MSFADRQEAGRRLAAALTHLKDEAPVVLALPRGGVPVAFEIAAALDAPLDIVLVRKIGAPFQEELAVGAVVDGEEPQTVLNADVMNACGVDEAYVRQEAARQLEEIARRRARYVGDRPRAPIKDRTAIIVDDGVATGATMRAAIRGVRRQGPKRLVLATPVAPPETIEALAREADETVCLERPALFWAIGSFYSDFRQLSDEEVVRLLDLAERQRGEQEVERR